MARIKKTIYNDDDLYSMKDGDVLFGPDENKLYAYPALIQAQSIGEEVVRLGDSIEGVRVIANNALVSADGKNRVFFSAIQPPGNDFIDGDTWFNSAEDNAIYIWRADHWVKSELGENAVANLSITNAKIANGTIQSAKISGLDVAKLTGGYIDALHINTSDLVIGQSTLGNVLSGKADVSDIPVDISELNNDVGYVTSGEIGKWYTGTGITGTSTTPSVYPNSGVNNAIVGDMYLNTNDGNTYTCTLGGNASVALWKYTSCIAGTGVTGIVLYSTVGNVKTYRMYYTDGSYDTFSITDGTDVTSQYVIYQNAQDGVKVALSDDATSYAQFNAYGEQVFKSGNQVASFGDHIELGKKFNNEHACHNIEIDPNAGIYFYNGNDEAASIEYSLLSKLSLAARYSSGRKSKLSLNNNCVLLNIDDTNGQLAWGIEITATGEIYLDGASIYMTGNKTFIKVEPKTFNAFIASGSSPNVRHDVDDEPGYTPIGVVGFDIDSANAGYLRLLRCNLSGKNVYFQVRNDSTSDISATFYADVLYLSN